MNKTRALSRLAAALMIALSVNVPSWAAEEPSCVNSMQTAIRTNKPICVPPIVVPVSAPEAADADAWSYGLCANYPNFFEVDQRAWCVAQGGHWGPIGAGEAGLGGMTCSLSAYPFDGTIVPFSDQYVRARFFDACKVQGPVDSGWGQTVSGQFCNGKAEGPAYQNGFLIRDFRTVDYSITTIDNLGKCTSTTELTVIAQKQRAVACPTGTRTQYKTNGDLECWYYPANSCDVSGSNESSGGGSGGASPGAGAVGPTGMAKSSCNLVGNPINTALLNKVQREEDLPGTSGGLRFVRYFNSNVLPTDYKETANQPSDYWRHTYQRNIAVPPADSPGLLAIANRESGQPDYFGLDGKILTNLNGAAATLQKTSNGWLLTQSNGDREIYNPSGKLLQLQTLDGKTQTLTYSDTATPSTIAPIPGLLITVTDHFGRTLQLTYDEDAQLHTATDPAGNTVTYDYDDDHRLTQVTYPDQTTRGYLYENSQFPHLLTGIIGASGTRLSTYTYNTYGEAIQTERADGSDRYTIDYSRDVSTTVLGQQISIITNALGGTTTKTYAAYGGALKPERIDRRTETSVKSEHFTYDANGNLAYYLDENTNKTEYAYDASRNLEIKRTEGMSYYATTDLTRTTSTEWHPTLRLPVRIAGPLSLTAMTYDSAGNLLTRTVQATTDANGSQGFNATTTGEPRTWRNDYQNGKQNKSTEPGGAFTTYTYYGNAEACTGGHYGCRGQLKSVANALGHTTTFGAYDALGRLLQSTDPNGVTTTRTFDWKGRQLTATQQTGTDTRTTTYRYDPEGRMIESRLPDASSLFYEYTAAGQMAAVRDAAGNRIEYTYDLMGRRTAETVKDTSNNLRRMNQQQLDPFGVLQKSLDASDNATTYLYGTAYNNSLLGELITVTDPLNRKTQHQYDALKRYIQTTDANEGATTYLYNARDQLTEVTDPRGLKTTYTYNGFGEPIAQASPDTGDTTYTYDAAGRLTTRTDAKGQTTTYRYDVLNRLVESKTNSLTTTYTYDEGQNKGRLTTLTDPAATTRYLYDKFGNIIQKQQTQATSNGSRTWVIQYTYTNGQLQSLTYPSGTKIDYTYTQGKPTTLKINGQPLLTNLTYEPFGPTNGWVWANGERFERTYDRNGRLTRQTLPARPAAQYRFRYDALNRLELSEALHSGETQTYAYDPTGNRSEETRNNALSLYTTAYTSNRLKQIAGAKQSAFLYDANGSTIQQTGANSIGFTYDARGRLTQANGTTYKINALEQRIEKQGNGADTPSGTRHFLHDEQGHLLGEYDPVSGTPQIEHIWLGDMPIATTKNNQTYYVYADHLNTPRAITNTANQVVWFWDYDQPFGETKPNDNPSNLGKFTYLLRFPGQYFDMETGNHYNWNRTYNPLIGRYVESDPIGLQGGFNTYAYVYQNPLRYSDPMGLFAGDNHRNLVRQAMQGDDCVNMEELADKTAGADYTSGSQRPENSYKHAMRDGAAGQSAAEAGAMYDAYVESQLSQCTVDGLANALHAVQDSAARGHKGFQPWAGGLPSKEHWGADWNPENSEWAEALNKTRELIGRYKSRCPCKC